MKIQKGQKNGLNCFIELQSYFHNVAVKWIQINYIEFCETPDGTRCFEVAQTPIIIQDNNSVTPPITKYTDYCTQFNASAIESAIDNYLSTL